MITRAISWRNLRKFTHDYAHLRNDYAMITHCLRMITRVRKHT